MNNAHELAFVIAVISIMTSAAAFINRPDPTGTAIAATQAGLGLVIYLLGRAYAKRRTKTKDRLADYDG